MDIPLIFPVALLWIALSIGVVLMFLGGCYVTLQIIDWFLERILRSLQIYHLFTMFMWSELSARRSKKEGK